MQGTVEAVVIEKKQEEIVAVIDEADKLIQLLGKIETLDLPSVVLQVMKQVEKECKEQKNKKKELALAVISKLLPASDSVLVGQLIESFIVLSKDPEVLQTVEIVSKVVEKVPKQCCVIS